ncbi:MAG: DnaB-like helicase C-terminal domain-containing protein, partial [Bacilli bacterium]
MFTFGSKPKEEPKQHEEKEEVKLEEVTIEPLEEADIPLNDLSDLKDVFEKDDEPFFVKQMRKTIKDVDEYSWSRGESLGGLDFGYESLNKAFEGLNTGVTLVAGQSNIGKSAAMMQLAWKVVESNKEVTPQRPREAFCLFFSLDDNNNELLPRFVAIDQRIPINAVRFPKKYSDNAAYMERRQKGIQTLYDSVNHFSMMDVNEGSDIEHILATIDQYWNELNRIDETYQLAVFIDNFHDITIGDEKMRSWEANRKFEHIADVLTKAASKYDIPIVCTAEFRKLNGNKRPTTDDIKESGKIVYEAKAIILCYNEVSMRGQQSNIYWNRSDSEDKQPIYEMHIGKNKFGSFKGRCY